MKCNFLLAFAAMSMFIFASCEDNGAENSVVTADVEVSAKDQSDADVATEEGLDYSEIGAAVAIEGGRVAKHPRLPECATVTVNKEAKTVVIDFGTGCMCPDGRTRAGKINIAFSGADITAGRARTITFSGYTVNGNAVAGTINTSAKIDRTALTKECNIKVENLTITFANGAVHTTTLASHTRVWNLVQGTVTNTGSATGITRNGNAFTASITSPIVRKKDCFEAGTPYPSSGVKQLEVATKPTFKIDFGTGECDDKATVYVGENSREITLRQR